MKKFLCLFIFLSFMFQGIVFSEDAFKLESTYVKKNNIYKGQLHCHTKKL